MNKNFSITFTIVDKDTPIYKVFSLETLDGMRVTKGDLPEMMGIDKWGEGVEWDTALPQDWLDSIAQWSGVPYNLIASTTFWVYHPKHARHGMPVSACDEVDRYLGTRPFFRIMDAQ